MHREARLRRLAREANRSASAEATTTSLLALALLVLAKPLKARVFPNRKEARRVRLVVGRGTPLAELREEIDASEVALERIVIRPGPDAEEDDAELG